MSDSTIAPPPKVDAECPHTHKHLVVESLTVKRPDGKGSVAIMSNDFATGLWVQSGEKTECIGLVAQRGLPPYLVIWPAGQSSGLPLAFCSDHIQCPTPPSADPVVIPFADLVAALYLIKEQGKS